MRLEQYPASELKKFGLNHIKRAVKLLDTNHLIEKSSQLKGLR